jgi:hypothetical protein
MNYDPFGSNPYNVVVEPIDWADKYAPYQMTYHGLTIVSNNYLVGKITSWQPAEMTRENKLTRELSYFTFGRPVDITPGPAADATYAVTGTSAEMWDKETEKRLMGDPGTLVFSDLMDQIRAFTVYEHWFKGLAPYRTWGYYGGWLNSKAYEAAFTVDGDGRVMSTFGFNYVSKVMLT